MVNYSRIDTLIRAAVLSKSKEINQVLENQLQAIDAQIRIQNYLRSAWMFMPDSPGIEK